MAGPDVWGPHGWKFIHYITLGYPKNPDEDMKIKTKQFFILMQDLLPCVLCRNNYKKHIKIYPLTDDVLSDREKFIDWGIKMHNLVNVKNNKREFSLEEGREVINKNINTSCNSGIEHFSSDTVTQESVMFKSKKKSKYKNILYILPIIIFGLILVKQIYKMKKNN